MRHSLLPVFALTAAVGLLLLACPGERDNPLDPGVFKDHDPFAVSVDTTSAGIAVAWHKVSGSGIKGYRIYRSEADTGQDVVAGNVSADMSTYTDGEVWAGRTYYYRVCAVGLRGEESVRSAYGGIKARGATLSVSPDSVAAPAEGDFNRTVRVQNGTGGSRFNWTASTPAGSAAWIELSKPSGTAPDSFQIQVTTENGTSQLRQGIVVVSASGATDGLDTIKVTQPAVPPQTPQLHLSDTAWRAAGLGDTLTVTVSNIGTGGSISYAVTADDNSISWLTVNSSSSSTPGSYSVITSANFDDSARNAVIVVNANGSLPETLLVHQPWMGWSPFGLGLNGPVNALTVYKGELVAGGQFSSAGDGTIVNNIARWNGSSWQALGSGTSTGAVYALAADPYSLYAGGQFDSAGGQLVNSIATWDGASWRAMDLGMDNEGDYATEVRALTWGTWRVAGGFFSAAGGQPAKNVALWMGSSWDDLGFELNGFVSALAMFQNRLIAGGQFYVSQPTGGGHIAAWDGSTQSWQKLGSGLNAFVSAVAVYRDELYATGGFTNEGARIARRDGSSWKTVGTGLNSFLGGRALAEFEGWLVVAGPFSSAGGVPAQGIARWDGSSWKSMGAGFLPAVSPLCMVVFDHHLVVGGSFTTASGHSVNHVARLEEQD